MYLLKKVFELREKAHSDHEKPFLEHLEDLRILVTRIVITLVVSMLFCFIFRDNLMDILRAPAEEVILVKQQETMPDADKHEGIRVPTVQMWMKAKDVGWIAGGLTADQRAAFFKALDEPDLEFHAKSVSYFRAARALPEKKQEDFVRSLKLDEEMTAQIIALLDSKPDADLSAGSNIRMMSALKPTETFTLSMKLAFFAGMILAFPLLLFFILQFVLPGLHETERKVLWPAMAIGFGLFLLGVLFAYFFVLPRALLFFYEWSGDMGVSNDWRIGEYITFATQFTLLFGLAFELPVVVMVLVKLGLLSYETMSKTRAYAVVAILIAAAIITPTPDVMTLMLMATPMWIMYEMCIWLAYFDRKKEREREAEEAEEERQRRLKWAEDNKHTEEYDEGEHVGHIAEMTDEEGDYGWDEGEAEFEHEADFEHDEDWVDPEDPQDDGTDKKD